MVKKVLFYVAYPYYFPHFLPISQALSSRGHHVHFVLSDTQNSPLMQKICEENGLEYTFGEKALFEIEADAVFFANPYEKAKLLKAKTFFLEHGIGTKSTGFYSSIVYFDTYLVEGSYKYARLKALYPEHAHKLKMVGFSKFDPIADLTTAQKETIAAKFGLDSGKKTILYAPTFFPSSIEKMADAFPDHFSDCNILIKAHYLTYERKQYRLQRKKLTHWSTYPNCTVVGVEEYDLLQFMAVADVMISDESSAMFEFASLNKPVISNRYFKLRLSYYLMPWKLKNRIDAQKARYREILDNAHHYEETRKLTREALENPNKLEAKRLAFAKEICGTIDGKVSQRITDLVEAL